MTLLSSDFTTTVRSPLPNGISHDAAVAALHEHEKIFRADSNFISCAAAPAPGNAAPHTKYYKVVNKVEVVAGIIPEGTTTMDAEMEDLADGVVRNVKATMGVKSVSTIRVVKGSPKDGAEWVLEEVSTIKASKLLIGTCKSRFEAGWSQLHQRFIASV